MLDLLLYFAGYILSPVRRAAAGWLQQTASLMRKTRLIHWQPVRATLRWTALFTKEGVRAMRRGLSLFGVLFALLVLLQPSALEAQVGGTISGYVQDQGGGAMPGATVTAALEGQQLVRSTPTNSTGFFDLQALPRGRYLVKVEMSGFETQVQKDIEVTAGANVRLDFMLKVGGLAEEVIVSGRPSMVETRNATQSNLIDDQRVQDLPMNGRNVVALAGMSANVTSIRAQQDTSDGRQGPIMSVNGGNTNHNLFTLNGSVFTHFNQTTGFNPPPPDAVQEIRIQAHNFSAEYGHTAGSQVSIVSKAGSNDFHGTAWEFHRNSALNARSFFQTRKPQQKQNQAGASAGGAVIRNKLFWFGSYQRLWDRAEAGSSQTVVPTDAQRAGNFTALSTQLRNPVNPITNAPFLDSGGNPCVVGNIISPSCISSVSRGLLQEHVPTSASGTVVTLAPSPRDHAVYMARGDYHFSGSNQLNAHFFADRSDSIVVAGQRELRGAGRFQRCEPVRRQRLAHLRTPAGQRSHLLLSDVHIRRGSAHADRPARSGRQRRRRQRRAGDDLHGVRLGQSELSGRERSGLLQLADQGHDDLHHRQPHDEVGVRVHPAGLRVQPGAPASGQLHGHPNRQCHRRLHDWCIRSIDDRVRHCRSQSVYLETPGVHRRLVENASAIDAELRPALRAFHPVRPERRPAHDVGAWRTVDRGDRRADGHSVSRRSRIAWPFDQQRSQQLCPSPRCGVGYQR